MEGRYLSRESIESFRDHLLREEKSSATIEKYTRDVTAFASYLGCGELTKDAVVSYKQHLIEKGYAVRSVNSMLSSINSLFCYLEWPDLRVRSIKMQQQAFCPEERELTGEEYERLCRTAQDKKNERLSLILQTICSTGIRVSELAFITAEAVRTGKAEVSLKGKTRIVLLPQKLQVRLKRYISGQKIRGGSIFVTRTGKNVSRSNIWREMKKLCGDAKVDPRKVFPHNLRHLFARVFYGVKNDIAKLADILGHSSINTTRIYIISTGTEHRQRMERMRLIL